MTKPPSPRPLSIKVIALLYYGLLFAKLAMGLKVKGHVLVLGFHVTEPIAYYLGLAFACMFLAFGIGLWTLRDSIRRLAIIFNMYVVVSLFLSIMGFANQPWYRDQAVHLSINTSQVLTFSTEFYLLWFIIGHSIAIYFLVTRKSAFGNGEVITT